MGGWQRKEGVRAATWPARTRDPFAFVRALPRLDRMVVSYRSPRPPLRGVSGGLAPCCDDLCCTQPSARFQDPRPSTALTPTGSLQRAPPMSACKPVAHALARVIRYISPEQIGGKGVAACRRQQNLMQRYVAKDVTHSREMSASWVAVCLPRDAWPRPNSPALLHSGPTALWTAVQPLSHLRLLSDFL